MPDQNHKKIIRLLGVGFDTEDEHVRITQGDQFDVLMGSEESHDFILKLIQKVEKTIKERGQSLDDLTPNEFTLLVESLI
jgi:hypothetical protein